jgi:hypothetical protein
MGDTYINLGHIKKILNIKFYTGFHIFPYGESLGPVVREASCLVPVNRLYLGSYDSDIYTTSTLSSFVQQAILYTQLSLTFNPT